MFAIKKLKNSPKCPNPQIFKLQHIRGWRQILELYITYQFFSTDVLHQDKKRWKQVKHHWFDMVQPIRPHLRWKFFTIGCKNVTILFSMWQEKLKIFMEWIIFFLHCHPFSYFIIHVCNQKIDKHSKMTKSWNFQTSAYQRLKSNFRVLHLIPIF